MPKIKIDGITFTLLHIIDGDFYLMVKIQSEYNSEINDFMHIHQIVNWECGGFVPWMNPSIKAKIMYPTILH